MRIIIISIAILICFLGKAAADDSKVNSVFSLIYNQQFTEAESELQNNKQHLNTFYFTVLNIDLYWWRYSSSRSRQDAKELNKLLKSIAPKSVNSEEDKMITLICKSYRLRYERKRYNLFGVVKYRSEINDLLAEIDKDNLPISAEEEKLFDLYISMFRYFENVNPFALGKNSESRQKHVVAMENLSENDNLLVNTMAHYFLGRIYQKVERKPLSGKHHFNFLHKKYPGNKLFKEYLEDCMRKL